MTVPGDTDTTLYLYCHLFFYDCFIPGSMDGTKQNDNRNEEFLLVRNIAFALSAQLLNTFFYFVADRARTGTQ
jgi:hypothetical protein